MQTKVITLGGVAGVGKTTTAREIAYRYGLSQRLGSGFVREILWTTTKNPCLSSHTYLVSAEPAYEHLVRQTLVMKDAINCCVDRSVREGSSTILEGNHLIPWELNNPNITHSIILYVDDQKKHWKLLTGKSHKLRQISEEEFGRIREMQISLMHLAEQHKVPLIESGRDLKLVLEDVEKVIK